MATEIVITVHGRPLPGGSKRGFPVRRKTGQIGVALVDANPNVAEWKMAVAAAFRAAYNGPPITGAVELSVRFIFQRPKSHYRSGKNTAKLKPSAPIHHTQKPDTTKLVRAIEDGLNGVAWADDCQVVTQAASKSWAIGQEPSRACVTIKSVVEV